MRIQLTLTIAFCFIIAHLQGAEQPAPSPTSPRATFNFNPGWKQFVGDPTNAASPEFDDVGWQPVTLPHAWNEDAAFKVAIDKHPTGIAWYRKHFKLPTDGTVEKVFLEFEGIRHGGEFYLNGQHLGRHENGAMAVGFDVTDFVKFAPEENVVAVRTDNAWDYREKATNQRYQWNDRNFNANYGGIPKNVKLHISDKLYQTLPLYSQLKTTGVYIYAQDFDLPGKAATISAESEVRNEHAEPRTFSYEVALVDMEGRTVKQFSGESTTLAAGETRIVKASARVGGLQFWSWGYGYLYTVRTTLKVEGRPADTVVTRTGFRKTEFGNGVIKLNGRVLQMKGYAQRTSNEWPALGNAVPPWLSDFSNGLIVEGNGNLVRWMHITPSKQDVESCDRVGLIQAMPAGDAESDVTGRRWEQRVELMRDAIIYNRNNPSILFYEGGNENISEAHMAELKALRDRYDPHGGRAAGCREMLDSQVAEYGGEMLYINKSARLPFWATEYSRDEGLRKYWDDVSPPFHKDGEGPLYKGQDASIYNRNQDTHAIEDVVRWYDYWRERPGTGTRVSSGGVNIIFSDSNTHYRGEENYRRSGEVDAMRIPKDGFWAHQVMWDGWVDVEQPRAHIIGHWNYTPGTKKNVYVVSSADAVELFLDGRSLGHGKQNSRFLCTFENIEWQPGVLRAVGLDDTGKTLCEAELHTAGKAAAVKLTAMAAPSGFKADGADVALIEVEVVDAQGRRCPTNLNLIEFELTGPAEWRGGIAQGPDNYILSKSLPVECGVNRVLVRSLPQAGMITVTAKSAGLESASVNIESHLIAVVDGLAKAFPCDALPSNLKRGPTPTTPSSKVTRIAIPIAGVTAGANPDKANASFDDNEMTSWTNDNKLATGWITYELARPATLSEVTMKLSGWRQRGYPIRITVDEQEVYRGQTPHSLGYVTLPLMPIKGKTVKVELVSASAVREGFNIVELENQQNASTGDERQGRGTLSIVEIEFYEKPDGMTRHRYKIAVADLMILKRQKLGAFQLAKDIGADGVEVDMGGLGDRETFDNQLTNAATRQQFLARANELGLEIPSLGMTGFFAQSFAERPTVPRMIQDCVDTMQAMNVKIAFLPLGVKGDLQKNPELRPLIIERLQMAGEIAARAGVVIGVETSLPAAEEVKLLDEVGSPAIKIYFNFANAIKNGRDLCTELRTLGKDRICQIHCTNEDGVWLENDPKINLAGVKQALDDMGWSGWLVIERSRDANDARNVKKNFGANAAFLKSVFQSE